MRIVIDLQGAQSTGSRNRGIGRYSLALAQAIVRNSGKHEILIALNGLFPDTIQPIRAAFNHLLPQENIRIWDFATPAYEIDPRNDWRRESAQLVRECFLASLAPDIIYITSLFEGLTDNAVTSVGDFICDIPTVVTLFDLIPLVQEEKYLSDSKVKAWYFSKLKYLRKSKLLLSISEASRQEGIKYLNLPPQTIVNVSTAANSIFGERPIPNHEAESIRQKFQLNRPFVMYTGGIDHRKNIEGLIRAFSLLPDAVKNSHQLAIVCSIQPNSRYELELLAKRQDLNLDSIILTGYVSEEDLISLYNLCEIFVFPSFHEGFGLPVLEAMTCGAPVIASNTSSLPEVVGLDEAMFDPADDRAIAEKISRALTDHDFKNKLTSHAREQAQKFSWDNSAQQVIKAFECLHAKNTAKFKGEVIFESRRKLAFFSPLPPERSGIADYSVELLPELSHYYDIEIISTHSEISNAWVKANLPIRTVDWFVENCERYERIIYQFGNSVFHSHMFSLLDRFPGVIVLHDFFLSGIKAFQELHSIFPGEWTKELYNSHGYNAVHSRFHSLDLAGVISKYPCNFSVLRNAFGIVVHSNYPASLSKKWYRNDLHQCWTYIRLLRKSPDDDQKISSRSEFGFSEDDFVVSCFGRIAETKQNLALLRAWLKSTLFQEKTCHLVFVGENDSTDYSKEILTEIEKCNSKNQIHITGWVNQNDFNSYLAISDLAVQLRTLSRGETSAAVLDCMKYGIPTIVNANGSMAELPQDAVLMLPDNFEETELIKALEFLWSDSNYRSKLGRRAKEVIVNDHSPSKCAKQYFEAIEKSYIENKNNRSDLLDRIAKLKNPPAEDKEYIAISEAIAQTFPDKKSARQLFIDISNCVQNGLNTDLKQSVQSILRALLLNHPSGYRVEPVYAMAGDYGYCYARKFTMEFLDCPQNVFSDEPLEVHVNDIFLCLAPDFKALLEHRKFLESFSNRGAKNYCIVYDKLLLNKLQQKSAEKADKNIEEYLQLVSNFEKILCVSYEVEKGFRDWNAIVDQKNSCSNKIYSFSSLSSSEFLDLEPNLIINELIGLAELNYNGSHSDEVQVNCPSL